MKLTLAIATLLAGFAAGRAQAYDINDWPTHYTFSNGIDVGVTGLYQADHTEITNDRLPNGSDAFEDLTTNRRKEFGVTLKKKGVYDAIAAYDFQSKLWVDVFLRVETKALFGEDYGKVRFGNSKTPVGLEGVTSSRAPSFMELALPVQAIYAGRRIGVDWALERQSYVLNVGYYFGQDIQGDNDGTTVGGRAAWTPFKADGHVLHLGVSGSIEDPDSFTNGRNQQLRPSARVRARPETGLSPVRLIDSGTLTNVDQINRRGLEAIWIKGPWSLQGEFLTIDIRRQAGLPNYSADGFYVFGSWLVTGESRPYAAGNVNNIKPKDTWGALEVLARYSTLDLDDGNIQGGKGHNWTLGVNWYLTQHFKFQVNYVRAYSDKGNLSIDPKIFEVRGQLYF